MAWRWIERRAESPAHGEGDRARGDGRLTFIL